MIAQRVFFGLPPGTGERMYAWERGELTGNQEIELFAILLGEKIALDIPAFSDRAERFLLDRVISLDGTILRYPEESE